MKKIYSRVNGVLLHIVHRFDEIVDRTNVAPEEEFLQLATLRMKKGKSFKPHKHIYKQGEDQVIAQESWVVIKGKVKVIMYDIDDKIIEMLNTDHPVIFDCLVDKQENCYPMIPSGKPHNQMLLGPKDQKNKKITRKGRTLV